MKVLTEVAKSLDEKIDYTFGNLLGLIIVIIGFVMGMSILFSLEEYSGVNQILTTIYMSMLFLMSMWLYRDNKEFRDMKGTVIIFLIAYLIAFIIMSEGFP